MKYYLVDTTLNWNDELDITSYQILTDKERDGMIDDFEDLGSKDINVEFGDNQHGFYCADEFLEILKTKSKEITKEEYDAFYNMFGDYYIGPVDLEDIILDFEDEYVYNDDEDSEDEDGDSEIW